jgi:hypothetical protein
VRVCFLEEYSGKIGCMAEAEGVLKVAPPAALVNGAPLEPLPPMKTFLALALLLSTTFALCAQRPPYSAPPAPAPQPPAKREEWKTYPAGQLPAGKAITEGEAVQLAGEDLAGKVLYLIGAFTVTASAEGRAVMRSNPDASPFRIVAGFPAAIPAPPEGAQVVRDATRGLRITDVRRGGDGKVTIFVRDITLP